MRNEKSIMHAPILVIEKGTLKAYCAECGEKIRIYKQAKCDKCGIVFYWDSKKGTEQ